MISFMYYNTNYKLFYLSSITKIYKTLKFIYLFYKYINFSDYNHMFKHKNIFILYFFKYHNIIIIKNINLIF